MATTPATSELAIGVPIPTKSMLITPLEPPPATAAFTTRDTVVVCVVEPLIPVIVSVKLPVGVLAAVVTVSVELVPAVIDVGLNEEIAPVGKPLALSATLLPKPFRALTLDT